MDYETRKVFFSRKNTASLVNADGKRLVLKKFDMGDPDVEWKILSDGHAKGIKVPRPILKEGRQILMEYLDGQPLANRESLEREECSGLAKWLHDFHNAFPGMIRGDAMLRNFIETKEGIYGIDFEESVPGDPLEDVARLCASVLTEDPVFTRQKISSVKHIIADYGHLSGSNINVDCVDLIMKCLFDIYRIRRDIRGKRSDNVLQWIPFCKTII